MNDKSATQTNEIEQATKISQQLNKTGPAPVTTQPLNPAGISFAPFSLIQSVNRPVASKTVEQVSTDSVNKSIHPAIPIIAPYPLNSFGMICNCFMHLYCL